MRKNVFYLIFVFQFFSIEEDPSSIEKNCFSWNTEMENQQQLSNLEFNIWYCFIFKSMLV